MKKYLYFISVIFCLCCFSCSTYSYDLDQMGAAVKQHMKYRDTENGTTTKIEYLKAVSYEKIPEDKREQPEDVYLCKVYIKGTWSYYDSYRVFNINDTIDCYFSGKKTLLRMGDLKER